MVLESEERGMVDVDLDEGASRTKTRATWRAEFLDFKKRANFYER